MEGFKNFSISKKLYVLVALASFFILLTSVIGYSFNAKTMQALDKIYSNNLMAIENLVFARANVNQMLANTVNLFVETSQTSKIELLNNSNDLKTDTTRRFEEYEQTDLSEQSKIVLKRYRETRSRVWAKINPAIELSKQGHNNEAYRLYKSTSSDVMQYRQDIDDLINIEKTNADSHYKESIEATQIANILLIIIGTASLILMVSLGLVISNAITKPIQQAIGELTTGSSEVSAAAGQVEAASQQLASGAAQQAASIQETSSAIEQTSSMVQQNNDNTRQAAIMAKTAKDSAQESNREMDAMMGSMDELTRSNSEIAKIIKVIDEIAFQTNILSLNAAVEAARAGDAGKGFAVVAEEVRNLAQRSAQAAKDTANIIESNITLFENSVIIAKNVNESLTKIDDESKKVSDLLEEISTATDEQTRGISEINRAIQQMEEVLQSNSSTAEESSAAAIELTSQAENVSQIIQSLVTLVEGVNTQNIQSLMTNKTTLIGSNSSRY